jgi:ATP-dependent helicase HrpB
LPVWGGGADRGGGGGARLGPGYCYRLWTRTTQDRLRPQDDPEILHTDLAPLALELAQWGVSRPQQLPWLDAPPAGAYTQARELLLELDAIDSRGRITPVGARLAQLPLHPRLSHMVFRALESGQQAEACDLAALLSERDILRSGVSGVRPCDLELRLHLLGQWREAGNEALAGSGATASGCRRVDRISRQWQRLLPAQASCLGSRLSVGGLLALAYPDRVAKRRSLTGSDYQLASGRVVHLPEADSLTTADFLVAPVIDAGRSHGRVFLGAALPETELRSVLGGHLQVLELVTWDQTKEAVAARREERLGSILLSSQTLSRPAPEALAAAMLQGIRSMGIACLPWSRSARDWQARVMSLRAWQPQAGWPDVSDATLQVELETWLAPYLAGIKRRADLQKLELAKILHNLLDWPRQQQLAALAPSHLEVPSGTRKRLDYVPGEAPVLAVRLQEMFGLADTPRVCGGQIPVMLHLLSPAQRPIQVTQDLSGFWNRTYGEIRKELKGRYPKHYWPEDPWAAQASARVRPGTR